MSRDALVVGINTYQFERLANLQAPSEDAEAIAQLLEQYGEFQVTRLPAVKDKQNNTIRVGKKTEVTLSQLEEAIVQLFKPESQQIPDTALLYFSGHGLRKNRGIQEGFLATSDVNPDLGNWGLSLRWLRRLLQESPVRQQIIWLDCCYSGEILNIAEADPGDRGRGRDRCFIAASRAFEQAYEEIGSNHSVLTAALLKGLLPQQQECINNYTLVDFLTQERHAFPQRPIFTNSGEAIILTRQKIISGKKPVSITQQTICPYKGLAYFDCNEEDPKNFYGRTALTDQLLEKVRLGNFLAVLGASGSGKSSVVRAGLLHQLQQGQRLSGSDQWQIYIMQPGEHPLQSLALAFVDPNLSPVERAKQLGNAEDLIAEGATGLRRLVQASPSRVLLVIDQFEEAFTLCQDKAERQKFFACILGALKQIGSPNVETLPVPNVETLHVPNVETLHVPNVETLHVPNVETLHVTSLQIIITMRADFFGKCLEQEYSGLAQQIQQNLVTVTPMNPDELRQAIVEPAKRVNLEIEPELVEEMLADVANAPGSLPLLQYALTELWKQRTDNCLRLQTYAQLGGVMGTLRKRATQVYESFSEAQQAAVQHIFLSLTQLGEGTEDTRRRVLKPDLVNERYSEQLIDEVVQKLADEKLIVTSEMVEKIPPTPLNKGGNDPTPLNKGGNEILVPPLIRGARGDQASGRVAVVDVAHEALIRQWPLLRQWIDENRDILRQKRKIEAAAEEWRNQGKAKGYLLQGKQLTDAMTFQKQQAEKVTISVLAQEFIQKSLRYRRNNRLKFVGMGLIIPVGLAIFMGVFSAIEIRKQQLWTRINAAQGQKDNLERISALQELVKLNVSLANIDLSGANLSGVNLSGANLSHANLNRANLSHTNLSRANLSNAKLSNANLNNANLNNANLSGTIFVGANLSHAIFVGANLSHAIFFGANFFRAYLIGANLGCFKIINYQGLCTNFRFAKNLTPEQVKSAKNWQHATYDDNFRKKLGLQK